MRDERNDLVVDDRLPAQLVDPEGDDVPLVPGFDDRCPGCAVQRKRHRQQRLQSIALGAAGRADIGLARGDAIGIIEDVAEGFGRHPACVIADGDLTACGRDLDADLGRDFGLFALVKRIVDELFEDHERPVLRVVTGLRGQFALSDELGKARCLERYALQRWGLPGPQRVQSVSSPPAEFAEVPKSALVSMRADGAVCRYKRLISCENSTSAGVASSTPSN